MMPSGSVFHPAHNDLTEVLILIVLDDAFWRDVIYMYP